MSFVVPPIDLNDPVFLTLSDENLRLHDDSDGWVDLFNGKVRPAKGWDGEAWGEIFCTDVRLALDYNAICWHSFRDDGSGVLRNQAYMPVAMAYELVPWACLPHNFNQYYELFGPGDPDFDRWYNDPYGMLARAGATREKVRWNMSMAYCWPPEPPSSERWAWVEFEPQIDSITECHFRWLREATGMSATQHEGTLEFLYKDRRLNAAVVLAHENDSRMYFSEVRPLMRPKNAAQYRELGLSQPGGGP